MKFFCDIGGLLGLWIGFSFLTVFEVVELLFDTMMVAVLKARGSAYAKKVKHFVPKVSRVNAAVPSYWMEPGDIMNRFDPDYRKCFSAETPSDVELKFHTPSPELLCDNEKDDVSEFGV